MSVLGTAPDSLAARALTALAAMQSSPPPVEPSMASIIDSLVNQLLPIKASSTALTAPRQSGVIEAVVLANSPLLNKSGGEPQIRVSLGSGEQKLELTTTLPLPVGAKVQLKLTADNLAVLLKIDERNATELPRQPLPLSGRAVTNSLQPLLSNATTAQGVTQPGPTTSTKATVDTGLPLLLVQQRQQVADAVRQALPLQQPLRDLMPVLQAVLQHPQPLPKPLSQALTQLLQIFPRPQQLQQSQPLKQALQDSGTFLESKLARPAADLSNATHPATSRLGNQPPPADAAKSADTLNRDIKALIERILPQVERLATGGANTTDPNAPTSPLATSYGINMPPAPTLNPGVSRNSHHGSAKHSGDQSVDVLLRQLSRQLLASLARTQLNQLDSISHRQSFTNDPQSPINSWTLELPIMNGQRVDNLDVRIEQRESGDGGKADKKLMSWTVMLNFDLHQLGKMQVQLNIIEKTVSAMIWSQLKETHEQVQHHINELRGGLEKVGVQVKKVECQIGIPPGNRHQLYRQLVDLHT